MTEGEIALVFIVAGLSSRFGGKIKQFAQVGPNNETLIEHSLKQALPAGFTKIIFVVGEKTEKSFREKFGSIYQGLPVLYALQSFDPVTRDKPWGTGDALCAALDLLDCPLVFCNGDDLYGESAFRKLVSDLKEGKENATVGYKLGCVLPRQGKVNRGIFKVHENKVKDIDEIFEISGENLSEKNLNHKSLCSMNIFALNHSTVQKLNESLIQFKQNHLGNRIIEFLLPVELDNLIRDGKITMHISDTDSKWHGVTNPGDEILIREALRK